jgi:hypothetical protein
MINIHFLSTYWLGVQGVNPPSMRRAAESQRQRLCATQLFLSLRLTLRAAESKNNSAPLYYLGDASVLPMDRMT